MIEETDIQKLAKLSRLELSPEDSLAMRSHLESMLTYVDSLRSLDLSKVEPMTSVDEPPTMLRPDVPGASLSADMAFKNAPRVEQDHFVIPKVMG